MCVFVLGASILPISTQHDENEKKITNEKLTFTFFSRRLSHTHTHIWVFFIGKENKNLKFGGIQNLKWEKRFVRVSHKRGFPIETDLKLFEFFFFFEMRHSTPSLPTLESNGKIAWWDLSTLFETHHNNYNCNFAEYYLSFHICSFTMGLTIMWQLECVEALFSCHSQSTILIINFERRMAHFHIFIYVQKENKLNQIK